MSHLIHKYLKHAVIGFAVAGALVAVLFWMDSGQLRPIVALSGSVWLAAALMWLGVGVVFAGVQCALVAKAGKDDDDSSPRGGGRGDNAHNTQVVPIPVRVEEKHHRRR